MNGSKSLNLIFVLFPFLIENKLHCYFNILLFEAVFGSLTFLPQVTYLLYKNENEDHNEFVKD